MLLRSDLPTYVMTGTAHVTGAGIWVYAGTSAATWTVTPQQPSPRKMDSALIFIKVRDTAGPLTLTRSSSDNFQFAAATATTMVLQPGESIILLSDGTNWTPHYGAQSPAINQRVVTSAAATLTLSRAGSLFVFTGTTTTWTLPAVANNTGLSYTIKNRGSGAITLQRAGTDNLYDTTTQTSISIAAGATARVVNDGTYWLVV